MEAIVDDIEIGNERLAWIQAGNDLRKPAFNRTEAEMSRIMTLLRRLDFFSSLPFNQRLALARTMGFLKLAVGETLISIEEEEKGRRSSGAGGVVRRVSKEQKPDEGNDKEKENGDGDPHSPSSPGTAEKKQKQMLLQQQQLQVPTGRKSYFFVVVFGSVGLQLKTVTGRVQSVVHRGEGFGQTLTRSALLPGSVYVTLEACEVLTFSKVQYDEMLKDLEQEEVARRQTFFRELVVPIFTAWSDDQLEALARNVFLMKYQSKELVVREGDPADAVFFILRGKLKVVREIDFTQAVGAPTVKLLELATLSEGEYFGELSLLRTHVDENRKMKLAKMTRSMSFSDSGDTDDERELKQIDPEIESIPRQATVYAHTPSVLLVLPRAKFIEFVTDSALIRMREYARGYPTQHDIHAHFMKQQRWEAFKGQIMAHVHGGAPISSSMH